MFPPITFWAAPTKKKNAPGKRALRFRFWVMFRPGFRWMPLRTSSIMKKFRNLWPDPGEYFALQIRGNSMEPKFSAGDVVIVRKQSDVNSGDIAVVLVNGDDATIKKIKKRPDGVMLIPNNPEFEPMFYSNQEIEELPVVVLGKVVELRAKF